MKIAVASGKGGTGKTTISINLYYFIDKFSDIPVQLVDCDVEEPNDALFFPGAQKKSKEQVFQLIPEIDKSKCTFCRKCVEWCEFNAISIVKSHGFAEVNASLCHSCGACLAACDFDAIREVRHPLGIISHFETGTGKGLTEGRLNVGSPMQSMLIREVKKQVHQPQGIVIFDAPPGTSCPVVQTIADVDFVILVTEPTPFGVHDLKITVELMLELQKPFGVIINKAGLGFPEIYRFLVEKNIELLGEVPFAKSYAGNYAVGKILENIPGEIEIIYREIIKKLNIKMGLS